MKHLLPIKLVISILAGEMKGLLGVFALILVAESYGVIHWLEHHLLSCPFKSMTGIDCPGCGFQRSVVALLRGDFLTSLKLYPATIPLFGLMIFLLLHLKFDFKNGAFFIKMMYILIIAIVIINYIYKVYHQQIF